MELQIISQLQISYSEEVVKKVESGFNGIYLHFVPSVLHKFILGASKLSATFYGFF